jgi:hypothetical protein
MKTALRQQKQNNELTLQNLRPVDRLSINRDPNVNMIIWQLLHCSKLRKEKAHGNYGKTKRLTGSKNNFG